MFNVTETWNRNCNLFDWLGKCIIGIQLHAQRKCMRIFIKADARINQVISGSESDFKKFSEFKIG